MAIILNDPRYQALDQVSYALGQKLGQDYQNKKVYNATQQFIAEQAANAQKASEAQGLFGNFQKKYGYLNEYEGLKKGYEAPGLTDEQRAEIVDKSKNLRQRALADGVELPGEELNYNDMRISNDDFARSNIGQIASQMEKTGLYGPALARFQADQVSDMGRDAGASPRPELQPVQGLLSSIDGLINEQVRKYSDPKQREAANAAFIAKHSFSPEQAKRVETMLQPRVTDAKTKRNAQLLRTLYNPFAADEDKIQAAQEYYQVNGLKLDGILEKLAPGYKTFTEDTGANINTVSLKTPNALGIGSYEAGVPRTTQKEIPPGTQAQMNLQGKIHEDNNALNWARFRQDANGIKQIITGDDGTVYGISNSGDVKSLANISTFSKEDAARVRALQTRMNNAIQFYKASQHSYDAEAETPGMKQAMDDYNKAAAELDAIFTKGQGGQQGQGSGQGKVVNYNSAISEITSALERNAKAPAGQKWNRQQIEAHILQKYGDMGEKLIADTDFRAYGM
ncbi:hypothetical protein [Sporomusa termitida]|uniref:Uncharacterized protein n=1 Tax=Sporomusa termitida TaxID=2377 RepID=A0A517DS99_9FIRM|nr:hypothetical protein [Sporomusa termitida]QDR80242.1 hypothetical protein SPTER_15610 [Sporomusa termitida]